MLYKLFLIFVLILAVSFPVAAQDATPTLQPSLTPTPTPQPATISVGAIMPFFGAPGAGWLPCDGSAIHRDDYPHLFNAVVLMPDFENSGMVFLPDCSGRALIASGLGEGLMPVNQGARLEWQIPAAQDGEQTQVIAGLGINYYIWSGSTGEEPEPMPTPLPDIISYSTIEVGEEVVPTAIQMSITAGEFAIVLGLLVVAGLLVLQIAQGRQRS